jgi:hypothetical protein
MLEMLIDLSKMLQQDIQFLIEELENKKNKLRETKLIIYDNCEHKWITDSIDIDPDTSKTIIFCEYCQLNKAS